MPIRLRPFAMLSMLMLGACGTIEAPVGLPFAGAASEKSADFKIQSSTNRAPMAPVVSTRSVANSAVTKKFDETVFARPSDTGAIINMLAASLPDPQADKSRSSQAADRSDRMQRLTLSEVKDFIDDYDADILRPFTSNTLRSETLNKSIMGTSQTVPTGGGASIQAGTGKSVEFPTEYQIHKAYIAAFLLGKYVDRSGQPHDAPDIKNGISNEVLTKLTKLFFDARTDVQPDTVFLASKDGKFYPSGLDKTPTYVTLARSLAASKDPTADESLEKVLGNRWIEVVPDVKSGAIWPKASMTVSKARMIGALATLAEKRSAISSGIAAELFGGFDLGFAVGGRFSVGDNKTAVELAKRIFASISYHRAERAAFSYLTTNDFDPNDEFAMFLNLLLAIDKQEAKDKEAAKPKT